MLRLDFYRWEQLWFFFFLRQETASLFSNGFYSFSNTDHVSVLPPQTDFEKDVDIACRSGKEQMVALSR